MALKSIFFHQSKLCIKVNIFDKQYIKEWRELGFFYSVDDLNKRWLFFGPKKSLLSFADKLSEYTKLPLHKNISEHKHFGPQEYLKVITSKEPGINSQGISGSLEDIERLANILRREMESAEVNDKISIDKQYSENPNYSICITVMDDDFDPSLLDHSINR
jgi:hypothetical protein